MNQDKIWDYYQNESMESFDGSYSRLNFIAKKFKKENRVLNIGVGAGIFEKIAKKEGIDVYSLDPSEKAIQRLESLLGSGKAKAGYSQNIPYEDSYFDGVVMSEVLEHLNDETISATLAEVVRVLKLNGKFIGTAPYKENLSEQIIVCPKCDEKFHRWGHLQTFDETRIANLLKGTFRKAKTDPMMFISWRALNWKGRIFAVFSFLMYKFRLKKSGLNLYFEGIK